MKPTQKDNKPESIKPPYDTELEKVVLGAMLLEQGAEVPILSILSEDSFYEDRHRKIFHAIVELSTSQKPIDIYSVSEQLAKDGVLEEVGGAYYVASLTEKVGSAAHLEFHARLVQQKAIARELMKIGTEISNRATDPTTDIDDLLIYAEKSVYDLNIAGVKKDVQDASTILAECARRQQALSEMQNGGISGVPTGFADMDRSLSGLHNGDMLILAARPAMGKTALALNIAKNIAISGKGVLVFSLEMTSTELMGRVISSHGSIPGDKLRSGSLDEYDWHQYEQTVAQLQKIPLYIDDTGGISLFELRSKAIRMKAQHNISCIVVDYLQLMTTGIREFRGNREQEVSTISRGLKNLAKELDVPIIALSQLSRANTTSGDPRPKLHHLRDSGAIEQDADIVLFIHRPEYYGITETEAGESTEGLAEIIVAKNRHGAVGSIYLNFLPRYVSFADHETIPTINQPF